MIYGSGSFPVPKLFCRSDREITKSVSCSASDNPILIWQFSCPETILRLRILIIRACALNLVNKVTCLKHRAIIPGVGVVDEVDGFYFIVSDRSILLTFANVRATSYQIDMALCRPHASKRDQERTARKTQEQKTAKLQRKCSTLSLKLAWHYQPVSHIVSWSQTLRVRGLAREIWSNPSWTTMVAPLVTD